MTKRGTKLVPQISICLIEPIEWNNGGMQNIKWGYAVGGQKLVNAEWSLILSNVSVWTQNAFIGARLCDLSKILLR